MNWVGGTRNRLRAKSEKKRQKEFFEKQKYARRMRLHQRGEGSKNDPSPSLDIISLQMAHLTAQQFKSIDTDKNSKPLKKVNMDRPCKNDFHIQRRHHNVELPTSPYSTPSILQLSDDIPRRDLPSGSIQAPRASTSALSECSKSFTSHQHHRLQENRSQAFCSHTSSRQTSRDSADDLTVSHSQVSGKKRISVDSMRMPSRFSESAILAKQNTFFLHDHAVKGRKSFSDSSIRQHERFSHDIRTPVKLPVETREGQYSEHTMTGMRRSGEGIPTGQRRYSDSPKADQQKPTGGLLEVQKRSSEDLFFQFTSVAQQSMRVTSSASSQIRQRRASSSTEMSMSTDSSDDCKIYTPEKYKQTQRCCRTDDVRNPGKENAKDQSKCESSYCDSCSYPHVIKKGNLETSRNYIRVEGDYKSIGSSEPHSSGIAGSPSSSTNIPDPVHAPDEPPSNTESKSSIDLLCHEVTNFTSPESDYSKNRGMQPNEIGQQLSQQHKGLHQHTLHTPCVLSTDNNKPSSTKKIRSSSNSSLSSLGDGFPRTVLQEVLELDADLNRRCSSPGIYGDIDELSSPKKRRKPNALFVESFNTYDMVSVGSHSSSSDSCITPPPEQSQRQNQSNPEYAVSGRTLSPFSNDVQQRALESIALSTPENLQEKNGDNLRNSKIAETYKQSQMKSQVKSLPADTNFTGSGMDQQQCPGSKENDFIGSGTNQLQVLSSSSSDQCIESRLDQLQHLGSEEDQYKDQIKSHDHASTDHHGIIKHKGMQCESVSVKTSVSEQATQCDISVSAVCNDTSTQTQDTLRCDVSTQWEENGNRFCDNEEKIQAEPSISEVEKSEDDVVTSGQQPHQLDIKSLMATTETLKYQQNAVLDESHKTCMFPSEDKVVEEVSVALDDELSKDEERKDKDDEMMQGDVVFVRKMEAESTDVQLNENSADSQCSMLSDSVNLFSIESSTSGTFDSCKSG